MIFPVYPSIYLVLLASAVAVVTDVRNRKIPNTVTFSLAAAALVVSAFNGVSGFAIAVGVMFAVLVVGFVAFSFGWLGGGDVKLLAAGAAALSIHDVLGFLVFTSIGGGLLAIVYSAIKGRLGDSLRSASLIARPFVFKGTVAVAPEQPITLPYGIAIALGAVTVALSHTVAPFLRLPF